MSEDKEKSKQQAIDLSELQNMQFSPAWTPSTNYAKFEPRGKGDFKKRDFKPRSKTEGDFKKREFRKRDDGANGSFRGDGERRSPHKSFQGKPGERRSDDRRDASKGAFKRKPPMPFSFTVEILFYPEDAPFAKLADVMKHLKRTYQLFDIAELVIEKPERFILLLKNLPMEDGTLRPLYCAQPENLPFDDEESAKKAAIEYWFGEMFETVVMEAEPPKGNFQVVHRTTLNGDLLGAPNWHKYGEYVREYHAQKFPNMPYEKFMTTIESVRDEAVTQWLEQMKKREVYKLKKDDEMFETRAAAYSYIAEKKGGELVKSYEQVRMHGSDVAKLPFSSRIRRNLEAAWSKQKRFPIVTANNLRGRLRRAGFTIYKRGSKGFAFVSAVKRKFLFEGDSLSENPQSIFDYIAANQGIKAGDLPYRYLGMPAPKGVAKAAPLAEEHKKQDEGAEVSPPLVVETAHEMSPEEAAKFKSVSNDLIWLISEGYVVEYADSSLQANPRLPKPKDKSAKTAASDTEAIVFGIEDEPIVASKEEEKDIPEEGMSSPLPSVSSDADMPENEGISDPSCESYRSECPEANVIIEPKEMEHGKEE